MHSQLFAMLILTSWVQEKRDWRPLPDPPGRSVVVSVGVMAGGNRQVRQITLAMPAPPEADDEDDDHRPAQPVMRPLNLNTAVVERENFDRWLFPDERSERARWRHLDAILGAKIETAARRHKLTDSQRAKLRLAGRGDIKRFFDHVEDRRNAFESDRKSFKTGYAALRRLNDLSQIYQDGPFDYGSLFAKTLQRINEDQKSGH